MAGRVEERDAWQLFELAATPDEGLSAYLQRILDRCASWFGATTVSLFLGENEADDLILAGVGGTEPTIPRGATIQRGAGVAGVTLETGEPLLINDPSDHPLLKGRLNRSLASSIVVPLGTSESGRFGVLNLSRKAGRAPFSPEDLARVSSFARQISLAVSNARLLARTNQAMREARQAGEKLEAVVRSLGVAVLVVDESGKVTDANLQARLLVGEIEQADLRSQLLSVSPSLAQQIAGSLDAARRGHTSRERAHDKAADRTWSLVVTPLPGGGATLAIEEMTSHERASREMARLARLAEIGQMTAAIAHEIRNPLTGILSAAQMIGDAPEHATEFAGIIEDEVRKLNSLCEEFLEFARPMVIRHAEVDPGGLAQTIAERMRKEFADKGVELRVQIDGDVPTISGDALRLEQVFRNLLRNALQACDAGGSVVLAVCERGFDVEDTGKGIEPERLERLFTPFFTTKADGTGLGLSNVKRILDAHGATISVTSELGSGTRFEVRWS